MGKNQVPLSFGKNENFGAEFSDDRKYRYALWRIWESTKPLVMFVGLNPSSASEIDSDPTIKSVGRIARHNGYGGFYMMNCFPYVSTDPKALYDFGNTKLNDYWLMKISAICQDVVFAWGTFEVVKKTGRDKQLLAMFPSALAITILPDGSPKHPLYCKKTSQLIAYGPARENNIGLLPR